MRTSDNSCKSSCMDWIGSNLIDDDTCPSVHIGLGLGCHIYADTTSKVISGLYKRENKVTSDLIIFELLTRVGRIDVRIGSDRI